MTQSGHLRRQTIFQASPIIGLIPYRRRWLRDQLRSRLRKRRGVLENNGSRFEHGLQKCLSKAAHARTPELKELWQTMAESYRCLLDHSGHKITHQSWLRNNAHRQTE